MRRKIVRNASFYRAFHAQQARFRLAQLSSMILVMKQQCAELEQGIEETEAKFRKHDPDDIAYPTYAKDARARRARLKTSIDALESELANMPSNAEQQRASA